MRTAVGIVAMAMAMIRALPRVNAKDRDVCEMRSDVVARVVMQRDKGFPRMKSRRQWLRQCRNSPLGWSTLSGITRIFRQRKLPLRTLTFV
jgi:hypothetical protein